MTEYYWLQVVYNRFPILLYDEQTRRKFLDLEYRRKSLEAGKLKLGVVGRVKQLIKDEKETWGEYTSMPIFWSESFHEAERGDCWTDTDRGLQHHCLLHLHI